LKPRKLRTLAELGRIVAAEKRLGRRVVLANGCFDLIHVGHIRYLRGAAKRGDLLVVALNSDRSVRALKGAGRPFMPQTERAELLSALECVDYVTIFAERNVERVLRALRPDVHAKGSDYTVHTVPERETVKALGGEVFIAGGPKVRSTRDVVKLVAGRKGARG
jgi:rfaE bifunctional protein nucleotidyltransferase chain/domain